MDSIFLTWKRKRKTGLSFNYALFALTKVTDFMEESNFLEANRPSAGKEIPCTA
jgi:hypothetical protein